MSATFCDKHQLKKKFVEYAGGYTGYECIECAKEEDHSLQSLIEKLRAQPPSVVIAFWVGFGAMQLLRIREALDKLIEHAEAERQKGAK